jgi:2-polyprenyl-3-methyl-5-hydroxy-6-metoxy-1,4-benzoquinol methylase
MATAEIISPEEFRLRIQTGEITQDNLYDYRAHVDIPAGDPLSKEYHAGVLENYRRLVGRDYSPAHCEIFTAPPNSSLRGTWPFCSGKTSEVGNYLGGIASALARLDLRAGSRILELGAGWGHLSLFLAAAGHNVTSYDINTESLIHLQERSDLLGAGLNTKCVPYEDWTEENPVDLIIFFESFHHASRPWNLLHRCASALQNGGQLLFIAESFYDDHFCAWNIQQDPHAAWMMITHNWLELAFDCRFVVKELQRLGFSVERYSNSQFGAYGTSLLASKSCG